MLKCFFRAFLASPILRELSSVKQENKIIKVKIGKRMFVKICFLYQDEFVNDPNRQQARSMETESNFLECFYLFNCMILFE
jgi:hypothetical protein